MNNKKIPRLPRRCEPIPGESLNGFVARLAEANKFGRAAWVAEVAEVRYPETWYSDEEIERFAVVAGLEAADLRAIAPMHRWKGGAGVWRAFGHDVPVEALVREARRVCPRCIEQPPHYHRVLWDMRFVRSCTEHGNRLLVACPKCRRKLGWRTPSVRQCSCGEDLTTAATVAVSEEALAGTRFLQSILLGCEQPIPALLIGLDFDEVFYLLSKFGYFRGGGLQFKLDDSVDPDVEQWLTYGLEVLSQDTGELERKLKFAALRWTPFPSQGTIELLEEVRSRLREMGQRAATLAEVVRRCLEDPPDSRGPLLGSAAKNG